MRTKISLRFQNQFPDCLLGRPRNCFLLPPVFDLTISFYTKIAGPLRSRFRLSLCRIPYFHGIFFHIRKEKSELNKGRRQLFFLSWLFIHNGDFDATVFCSTFFGCVRGDWNCVSESLSEYLVPVFNTQRNQIVCNGLRS